MPWVSFCPGTWPLRVAGQPVRSFRTRNVTGCPGSQEVFHPLFKPHCYAPLETLLTTFARPTSSRLFDPKQLIGALWIWNIRYRRISKGAYFENDLNLRKGERRAQVEFRSSRLSQFRSKPVIILIQGVFEVVVQIVKIKCRHFSNTWLNELSITILIVFILFVVHSTYIFFQIVHHGNFTHLNLLISRILTTLIFLINLKRLFHLTKLLSHATFRTKDFPFPFSLEQPFRWLETFSMFSMFPWDGSFNYAIKILARRKQHGWKWRSLIEDGWMASIKRTSFARFDNNQSDAPFIRTHWIRNNYPSFPTNQYNVHIEFQFLSPSSLSVSGCNTEHKRDHTFPVTRDWSLIAKTSRIVLVSAIYV